MDDPKMILSFHPCLKCDENILCAGREPGPSDLAAICRANAVILPQGVSQALYQMARDHCPLVFPNYDARFAYPGKIGQIRLFQETGTPHPQTLCFSSVKAMNRYPSNTADGFGLGFPLIFKFNWGGEGETVFPVASEQALNRLFRQASVFEAQGCHGFLLQKRLPGAHRSLRVVVIGKSKHIYWRIQPDRQRFGTALSAGATIDHRLAPGLRRAVAAQVDRLCAKTGIDLAGFDLLQSDVSGNDFNLIEINYFFGRQGLGGSENYYRLLESELIHRCHQWGIPGLLAYSDA
jgi:ribosomal protein S6--L-glutamate ligase